MGRRAEPSLTCRGFPFPSGRHLVGFLDHLVGQLLHLGLGALALVLRDFLLVLVGLQRFHAVAAHVADRDLGLFGILAGQLGQFLAAFLGQVGDRQAHVVAVVDRVEPRPAERIAFSTGVTFDLSQTCTESMRGSGAETVATWLSGMFAP
jgi:hypothetical protein